MPQRITQVQPPLEFIPPCFNPFVLKTTQLLSPLVMKTWASVTEVHGINVERLVDLYQQFQAGKIRFLLAFRHPSIDDSLSMFQLLHQLVPRTARQQGVKFTAPTHSYFVYDRGIPLWTGDWTSWLYSRLGGISVFRGKVDRLGLRATRDTFANGQFPIAVAPEGATNGHGEIVSPLEPGIAQMGFWCVEDLLSANRTEQVLIVPIGIQYRYVKAPWHRLESLLQTLELQAGLPPLTVENQPLADLPVAALDQHWSQQQNALYQRLYRLGEHLLTLMEAFYARFYHQPLTRNETAQTVADTCNDRLAMRLQVLLDGVLRVTEQHFGLISKGTVVDRCRRIEQAAWDIIYREDFHTLKMAPAVEQRLADRVAADANFYLWHMRMAESFVSVTCRYVLEKPTVERFSETLLLLWDLVNRIQDGSPLSRPRLGEQSVCLSVGEPISVSDRWGVYQTNRRHAKQAVMDLTQDLQTAFERML
jgi:hypothetical protein